MMRMKRYVAREKRRKKESDKKRKTLKLSFLSSSKRKTWMETCEVSLVRGVCGKQPSDSASATARNGQ